MARLVLAGRLLLVGGGLLALVSLTALTYSVTGPNGGVVFHLPTLVPASLLFVSGGILLLARRMAGPRGGAGQAAGSPPGQSP